MREDSRSPVLNEVLADDEAQLQEHLKLHPDLLPVEEFGLSGPLMIIGRESALPSGAIDLLGISREGEVLLAEFKTGPKNPDFRTALAQAVDYGSHLWQMTYEDLERLVAVRYFTGDRCSEDSPTKNMTSLRSAALATWPDLSEEDALVFRQRLEEVLATGTFSFAVVAQRFTAPMERTAEYLTTVTSMSVYLIELVRFSGDGLSAFEARTVFKPSPRRRRGPQGPPLDEEEFLEAISDESFRDAVRHLFDAARRLGLTIFWGTSGVSLRLTTPEKPVSIAWLFPPGAISGWRGLCDLNLGCIKKDLDAAGSVQQALAEYVKSVSELPGASPVQNDYFSAFEFRPPIEVETVDAMVDSFSRLVEHGGS